MAPTTSAIPWQPTSPAPNTSRPRCAAREDGYSLEAPELLQSVDEFGDGIGLQILSIFPGFVLQQIRNSLAVRRIVPQGLDAGAGVDVLRVRTTTMTEHQRIATASGQP